MNIPSAPLLNIATRSPRQPLTQNAVSPRFGSKLDEFRGKQAALARQEAELKRQNLSKEFKKIGDCEIHFTTGETCKVVDFLVHLYEHGRCTLPALLKSLPIGEVDEQILLTKLDKLAESQCLLKTAHGYPVEAKFSLSEESVALLEAAYPDLQLPEGGKIYAVSDAPAFVEEKPFPLQRWIEGLRHSIIQRLLAA